jgi:hypothetical protein
MQFPLLDSFTNNPFLLGLAILQVPAITNGDFSLFGTIEKIGIIGTLAYLNYQQRNDIKEQQLAFREEEKAIIKLYEKRLEEKEKQVFELIQKIINN